MRLRKGRTSTSVEDSIAIFVTANTALAKAAREYCYEQTAASTIPPCITDNAFTDILWLKKPLRMPDLPVKRIIADSYAAMQPDSDLWHSFLREVDRLRASGSVSEDDALLLRHSIESKSILMDKTMGEEDAFTQGTIQEVLETLRKSIQDEIRDELASVKAEKEVLESEKQMREAHWRRIGVIAGRLVARLAAVIFFGVFVVGAFMTSRIFPQRLAARVLLYSIEAAAVLLTGLNLFLGVTVRTIMRQIETRVENMIVRFGDFH
jgi:hypothetical protein